MKKSIILVTIMTVIILVFAIREDGYFMVPMLFIVIPFIFVSISYGYDASSKFEQFIFSTPIKKSDYVLSKLFFPLIYGIIGAIATFLMLKHSNKFEMNIILFSSILTMILCMLVSAFNLSFLLKFGEEKARIVIVLFYFLIFGLSSFVSHNEVFKAKLVEFINSQSLNSLMILILAIGIILLAISIFSSIKILINKEY